MSPMSAQPRRELGNCVSGQIQSLTSLALAVKAEGARFRIMRSRDVADTVVVLALSVGAALAGRVIGAGPVLNREVDQSSVRMRYLVTRLQ